MRNMLLGIVAASLLAVPGAFASTNSVRPERSQPNAEMRVEHHVKYLSTVLSLSSEQQQKATSIFTNAANENSPVFKNLKTERKELAAAVEENEPNNRIKQISGKIGNDVSQLACNVASAGEQFYKVLNPQQQTKLTKLQNENFGRMGMGWGAQGM